MGLSEIRDKMEEVRTGESRSRGSGERRAGACCFDAAAGCCFDDPALLSSVSSGELMAAESVMSLRGSSASLRRSQWSLRGQ